MWRAIELVKPGAHLGDIGHAIQSMAEAEGFSVVREYCGHGIGRVYHEDPQILHYGEPDTGLEMRAGPWSQGITRCPRSGSTWCWSRRPDTKCSH